MDDKIIAKISKLLALGEGSNFSGEADASLQKAYALMQEHNISMAQVEGANRDTELGPLGEETMVIQPSKRWEVVLLQALAKLFDCRLWDRQRRIDWNHMQTLTFIVGREGNRVTTILMYKWLKDKIRYDSCLHASGASGKQSYCLGVAMGILSKVHEIKKNAETDKDAWGLVPADEVNDWLHKEHPDLVAGKRYDLNISDYKAFAAGHTDGKNTNLNKQFAQQALPCA